MHPEVAFRLPLPRASVKHARVLFDRLQTNWADVVAVLVLSILIAAKSWEFNHFSQWMARVDVLTQYLPWWSYLGEQLRQFNAPGWNPHQFSGTPFLGDPQSGWMYLPVMTVFTVFSPVAAFKAYVVVQLLIGGLSTYAFARVLRLRPVGSLTAAAAFVFGPFLHHNTYCCNIQANVAAWIPLALLGIELELRARTIGSRVAGLGLAGFGISQMLAGWLGQGSYNGLLVIASYIAYRVLTSRDKTWKVRLQHVVLIGGLVLLVGLGLGAAAVMPRLDINPETNLAGGQYTNVETPSPNPGIDFDSLVAFLFASDFRNRRYYIGSATVVLALLAPLVALRRIPVPYFAAYSVVVPVMALHETPLHRLFYLLPRYQELHEHDPRRILAVFMIGPAILAGITVDSLPRWRSRPWVIAAVLIPFIFLLIVRFRANWPRSEELQPEPPLLITAVAMTALLLIGVIAVHPAVVKRTRRSITLGNLMPVAILLLLLWEPAGREFVNTLRQSRVVRDTPTTIRVNSSSKDPGGAGEFLQLQLALTEEPFRYFGYDGGGLRTQNREGVVYQQRRRLPHFQALLVGARATRLGLYDIQGYNPIQLTRYVDLFLSINGEALEYHDEVVLPQGPWSPWMDNLNVRFIVVPSTVPPGRPDLLHLSQRNPTVFANELTRVLENESVLPRVWIVHEAQVEPAINSIALIEAGAVDPRKTALLEPDVDMPAVEPASGVEQAAVTDFQADELVATVTLSAPGIVVFSEVFDPGWHAFVDGERSEIYAVDGVLRGVAVSAGTHEIEMRYEPRSIHWGLLITLLTALAVLMASIGLRKRPVHPLVNGPAEYPEPGRLPA